MPRRALILGLCLTAIIAHGQTHKVAAPEKVTRALAVYEYTGDLEKPDAARLIPVSLFINGQFQDADVYLADPVPFALDTGIVYSIERAGDPIGTLDLDYARNIVTRRSASDDNPIGVWYGYGRFLSPAEEAKLKPKPAKLPVVIASTDSANPDDDKPKFVRRNPTSSPTTTPSSPGATAQPTTYNPQPTTPEDDPDRPTLRHRDPTDSAKKKGSNKPTGYVSGPSTSLNDDPDRPTLRRGVPNGVVTPSQLTGTPPNLHQVVAVSDAANRDTHLFNREWDSSSERAETLAALQTLAKPRIANYILTNKLSTPNPTTNNQQPATGSRKPTTYNLQPTTRTIRTTHPSTKKPTPTPTFTLTNEHLSGYTLTYGGLPTFIYTAEVPLADGGPIYLTLVAQRLPSSDYQLSLASITDATHLDRTPWLRPIDVVDPDWSHRGSLLFELRAQSSRQFALYRIITAQAEQSFITGIIE
jgi:hypothetical protein